MSRRFLVSVILLAAAIVTFPTRSEAAVVHARPSDDGCDCCCDSTHKYRLIYNEKIDYKLYSYHGDLPYEIGSTFGPAKAGIVGIGGQFDWRFGRHWSAMIDGGYGIGDSKTTTTNPGGISNTVDLKLKSYELGLGLDYHRRAISYGFGVEMFGTTPTLTQTGSPDIKPSAFKAYAFDARCGGDIPVAPHWRLFGAESAAVGVGRFDDTFNGFKTKTSNILTLNTVKGGLEWRP